MFKAGMVVRICSDEDAVKVLQVSCGGYPRSRMRPVLGKVGTVKYVDKRFVRVEVSGSGTFDINPGLLAVTRNWSLPNPEEFPKEEPQPTTSLPEQLLNLMDAPIDSFQIEFTESDLLDCFEKVCNGCITNNCSEFLDPPVDNDIAVEMIKERKREPEKMRPPSFETMSIPDQINPYSEDPGFHSSGFNNTTPLDRLRLADVIVDSFPYETVSIPVENNQYAEYDMISVPGENNQDSTDTGFDSIKARSDTWDINSQESDDVLS